MSETRQQINDILDLYNGGKLTYEEASQQIIAVQQEQQ